MSEMGNKNPIPGQSNCFVSKDSGKNQALNSDSKIKLKKDQWLLWIFGIAFIAIIIVVSIACMSVGLVFFLRRTKEAQKDTEETSQEHF